jgi:hypothetical protein
MALLLTKENGWGEVFVSFDSKAVSILQSQGAGPACYETPALRTQASQTIERCYQARSMRSIQ